MKAIWKRLFAGRTDQTIDDKSDHKALHTMLSRVDAPARCPWQDPAHAHYFGQMGL